VRNENLRSQIVTVNRDKQEDEKPKMKIGYVKENRCLSEKENEELKPYRAAIDSFCSAKACRIKCSCSPCPVVCREARTARGIQQGWLNKSA
jgi:hypothetical protein